jgi:cbb3-type cytochrome oxidase maturation protein
VSILFVLIPLAVLMFGAALAAFFWAVRHAQFDDLDSPGVRVLLDDEAGAPPTRTPE